MAVCSLHIAKSSLKQQTIQYYELLETWTCHSRAACHPGAIFWSAAIHLTRHIFSSLLSLDEDANRAHLHISFGRVFSRVTRGPNCYGAKLRQNAFSCFGAVLFYMLAAGNVPRGGGWKLAVNRTPFTPDSAIQKCTRCSFCARRSCTGSACFEFYLFPLSLRAS